MFFTAFFTGLLLASGAVAFPSGLAARLARRREGFQSQPGKHVTSNVIAGSSTIYYNNWAGAVWTEDDGTFTAVTGTFTIPTVSGSSGDAATAWVGIDGSSCQEAILQTGVDFEVGDDDSVYYYAWHEWWPALWIDFTDISFSAGDEVRLTVQAYSTTSGIAIVENLSTGVTVSEEIGDPKHPLCEQNAEWIVEDYTSGSTGQLVPLANFGTVTFTDAAAETSSGLSYYPDGATIVVMEQNGVILTDTTISGSGSDSSVTIEYIGPN